MAKKNEGTNMLTKKDLLEAIEDMPMDAEIYVPLFGHEPRWEKAVEAELDEENNHIMIC